MMLEKDTVWRQKEFERLYVIMKRRGGPYPSHLVGIFEQQNRLLGHENRNEVVRVGFDKRPKKYVDGSWLEWMQVR